MPESQGPGQPFTIDVNRYLKLEIEKQTAAKVDEIIRSKSELALRIGKFLLPTLILIMILIIGSVTYWQITSFKELQEKTEVAKKSADRLTQLTTKAEDNLNQATKLVANATQSLKQSFDTTLTIAKSVTDSTTQIIKSQDRLIEAQVQIASLQRKLKSKVDVQVRQAKIHKKAANALYKKAEDKFTELEQTANQMDNMSKKISKQATKVGGIHQKVLLQEGNLQNLIKLNKEIMNLKAAYTIWIRQHRESESIKLPDIAKPGSAAFFIKLKIGDIKRSTVLEYRLKLPNATNWIPENNGWIKLLTIKDPSSKDEQTHQPPTIIPDTPYEVKVMFINHSFRGRDFVALRIQPHN